MKRPGRPTLLGMSLFALVAFLTWGAAYGA